MSNNNNQINIPPARKTMDRFKMQAASEVGVNPQGDYNGHLICHKASDLGCKW